MHVVVQFFKKKSFTYYFDIFNNKLHVCSTQDCEIKEEGTKHMLILYNVRMDMAGGVDFSAANAKSSAQLRVKGENPLKCAKNKHLANIILCNYWF